MKDNISQGDLEQYIDGECGPLEAERIACALEADATLREQAERLRRLNQLLRSNVGGIVAPKALRDAVESQGYAATASKSPRQLPTRSHGRRGFLFGAGGAIAAGVVAGIVTLKLRSPSHSGANVVETFFQDFETYLAKDKVVDVTETRFGPIASWFHGRLPFDLPPVTLNEADDAMLVGGRLCWLLERRMASLSFDTQQGDVVLYVMDAVGIAMPESTEQWDIGESLSSHRSASSASLIWKSDQQVLVMVGTVNAVRLKSIARSLLG